MGRKVFERAPSVGQVDHLCEVLRTEKKRTIVCVHSKRMSEDLAEYLKEKGSKTLYLHSDISPAEQKKVVDRFSSGEYPVLVIVSPIRSISCDASTVAILDAGSGWGATALTGFGRLARERIIVYADELTSRLTSVFPQLT